MSLNGSKFGLFLPYFDFTSSKEQTTIMSKRHVFVKNYFYCLKYNDLKQYKWEDFNHYYMHYYDFGCGV